MLANYPILNIVYAVLFFVILIGLAVVIFAIKKRGKLAAEPAYITNRDKSLRITSIVLNCVWGVLLVPITPISFFAMIATIMMSDSGKILASSILS